MKLLKLTFAVLLISSSFSSCLTAHTYRAANGESEKHYEIVAIDSVLLTDSNEVIIHLKTKRGKKKMVERIAVISPNVPSRYNFIYEGKKVYKTPVIGEVVKKLEVIQYPQLPKINPRVDFDSLWYKRRLDSLERHPNGYFMAGRLPDYSLAVAYMYKVDTGIVTNSTALMPKMSLTRPYYLLLLPATAALDAVAISAAVAVAIPIGIGWGIYELIW